MVTTFKIGDEVRVINPNLKFKELEGKVTGMHTDLAYLPIVVDLDVYGIWSFKDSDLELKSKIKKSDDPTILKGKLKRTGKDSFNFTTEKPKQFDGTILLAKADELRKIVNDTADASVKASKRPYKRKVKVEKPKRKYTKRNVKD